MQLLLNDRSAAQFGSEGQKRTLAIALKLAQAEYLTGLHGSPPVLLIDDIMGELDAKRRGGFLPLLRAGAAVARPGLHDSHGGELAEEPGRELQRWRVKEGTLFKESQIDFTCVVTSCHAVALIALACSAPPRATGRSSAARSGDGISTSTNLPLRWSEQQNVKWKTPIHGRAWSSPVIWGQQVWLTTATTNGQELFAALRRSRHRQGHSRPEAVRRRQAAVSAIPSTAMPRPRRPSKRGGST